MSRLDELNGEFRSLQRRQREGIISADEYLRRLDEILNEKLAYLDSLKTVEVTSQLEEAIAK